MKPRVSLVHRPRSVLPPASTAVVQKQKDSEEKSRGVYPLYRGVQHTPLFLTSDDQGKREQDLDALVAFILALPTATRKTILARLALAETKEPASGRDFDMWTAAVYARLVDAIGVGSGVLPAPMLLRRALAVTSSWEAVSDFMKVAKLTEVQVTHRNAVYVMLADLVVKDAQRISRRTDVPLTGKFVASVAVNIAAIFDAAFPGYLRSGLVRVVAARLATTAAIEKSL